MSNIREQISGVTAESKPAEAGSTTVDLATTGTFPTEGTKGRTVKYNKEATFVPEEQVDTLIQKGLHHDKVQERLEAATNLLTRTAKANGYDSVEEYQAALDTKEQDAIRQNIEDAYGDPDRMEEAIKQHPLVRQAAEISARATRESIKTSLRGKALFSELEPEFDIMMDANPDIAPSTVYMFLLGKAMDEGKLDELRANTKKQTNAEIQDQSRRGTPKGSASSQESVTMTERGRQIANIFGVDPAKVARRMKG